ncbi:predicted protein [Streptomyces viridosporus ATCC 14672]|uniref:Predicted protein n=1 Tax=Streptomyces viridosporus (strain ATCC 14672 / DSM 40746 / JCM 4963 / KCTC 9882 / NRRL B-12104 / FH 1290) TaxID=566461 RepID=D5ZPN9_STRV1|nr:predicted protein [Streptomyces viridosporus ATCC 14672]
MQTHGTGPLGGRYTGRLWRLCQWRWLHSAGVSGAKLRCCEVPRQCFRVTIVGRVDESNARTVVLCALPCSKSP